MSVRYAAALLLLGVVGVPLAYGMFFDGMFVDDGRLPTWLIAMSLAAAAGISVAVLWWVKRTVSASDGNRTAVDPNDFVLILGGVVILTQAVAMGAELLLRTPAAWLAPSIGAVTFGGLAVWLSRRQISRS